MELNYNMISDALLDAYDVKRTLLSSNPEALRKPRDNEGTEITVGDCLDNIIEILEALELLDTPQPSNPSV